MIDNDNADLCKIRQKLSPYPFLEFSRLQPIPNSWFEHQIIGEV